MIRKFRAEDLDRVMKIWLDSNVSAHSFVPEAYWKDQEEGVREQIPLAEVYVWEEAGEILGFIGLAGEEAAGIFVREGFRDRGIGGALLEYVKQIRERLFLCVYEQNRRALPFYERHGFQKERKQTDSDTGETEYRMFWERDRQ